MNEAQTKRSGIPRRALLAQLAAPRRLRFRRWMPKAFPASELLTVS
jgi:hypothetical protein